MDDLEAIRAEIKDLRGFSRETWRSLRESQKAVEALRKELSDSQKAIEALQKENYSLKARVFALTRDIYLMNYKPKQNGQQENV